MVLGQRGVCVSNISRGGGGEGLGFSFTSLHVQQNLYTISIIKQEIQKGSFVISVTMGAVDGGLPYISCVPIVLVSGAM